MEKLDSRLVMDFKFNAREVKKYTSNFNSQYFIVVPNT
jgi:hypothetical protein